jgi:hypothetical protein
MIEDHGGAICVVEMKIFNIQFSEWMFGGNDKGGGGTLKFPQFFSRKLLPS